MADYGKILEDLQAHAMRLGQFSSVNGHEPKSPRLGDQVNLSFWSGPITPIQSSGLNSVSYRWEVQGRIYASAESEPTDAIDPALVTATMALLSSLAGAFSFGEQLRAIDFFGSDGEQLSATPGYYDYGEQTLRTMDLVIPLLLNDVTNLAR